jgi:hypothetical protein
MGANEITDGLADLVGGVVAAAIVRKRDAAEKARKAARQLSMLLFVFGAYATAGAAALILIPKSPWEQFTGQATFSTGVDSITRLILNGVFAFGVVGIAIWIIQVAVTFIRYFVRLANVLNAQADALLLSGGRPEELKIYADVLTPEVVELGAIPKSTHEKLLEVVSRLKP